MMTMTGVVIFGKEAMHLLLKKEVCMCMYVLILFVGSVHAE